MQTIPILELSLVFIPTIFLLAIMFRWQLKAFTGLYANIRMVLQLFLVGYFLTYVFETKEPVVIILLVVVMIGVSAWIALRSFEEKDVKSYFIFFYLNWFAGVDLTWVGNAICVTDAKMVRA